MNDEYITIDFFPIQQPIGTFYIGKIGWKELIQIAGADIRKIHEESDNDNSFDSYLGIQRKTSPGRIKEIGKYVNTIDSTFPTSIILHISSDPEPKDEDEEGDEKNDDDITNIEIIEEGKVKKLKIRSDENVAKILDGQHRIEGLKYGFGEYYEKENLEGEPPKFEFNVTIFVDLDLDDQAQIFSVINKAQTKVNKSLVYDLYDYAKSRSPQKTAHDIVRLLNRLEKSPFYKRIKILGTAENKELETIAQATFVELIIKYISKDPMKDRDILKRKMLFGKSKLEKLEDSESKEKESRFFRNMFIDQRDEDIMAILWNYFKAVQERWPDAWNERIEGNILIKSTGLIALMKFLKPVMSFLGFNDQVVEQEKFQEIFNKIELESNDFTKERYVPGSSGQSALYRDLLTLSQIGD